jgi:hypothetical protein
MQQQRGYHMCVYILLILLLFEESKQSVRTNGAEVRGEQTGEPRDHDSWKSIEISLGGS